MKLVEDSLYPFIAKKCTLFVLAIEGTMSRRPKHQTVPLWHCGPEGLATAQISTVNYPIRITVGSGVLCRKVMVNYSSVELK